MNFTEAEGRQKYDFDEVRQIARRYFPAKYQEDFLARSPAKGLSDHKARAGQEREAQRRKAEASLQLAQEEAKVNRIFAGLLLALLLVPLAILALLIRHTRRNQGRNTTSSNRISRVEDLHLFDAIGQAIDVQRHTKTHVTTTTSSGGYVHPDSWQARAPSTTTTVRTTDHLALFVRTDDGREIQESFVDLDINVRAGRVGIVYAGDKWSRFGLVMAVANLDTGQASVEQRTASRIASRIAILQAAFWSLAVAVVGVAIDVAIGHFVFTLPALALGLLLAPVLAFAWQWSLWGKISGAVARHAKQLAGAR